MFARALFCKGFAPFTTIRKSFSNVTQQVCTSENKKRSSRTDFGREVLLNSKTERNNIKVYIKSFGCSHNMSDGEYMAGLLDNGGYTITTKKEEANIWIINTCTVRDKSIFSFERYYKEASALHIPVIISGCMTEADRDLVQKYKNNTIVGVKEIHHIKEIVDKTLQGGRGLSPSDPLLSKDPTDMPPLQLPKVRKDPAVEIIPLSLGCNGACTFCQTKLARGNLQSYPPSEILARVRECKQNGIREIWLTSEDVGAYGTDRGETISPLLQQIKQEVEDTDVMVKLGMTNPPYLTANLPAIVEVLNHKNFYSYLHIPVQSGSNAVLRRMNRKYQVEEFVSICKQLQQHVPGITLTTDIIVGFPFETAVDHHATMTLLKNLQLSIVHYSKYYPRPHTLAATYPQLPREVVNLRVKELSDWFKGLSCYEGLLNQYLVVWVSNERVGSKRCCHSKNYTKILVEEDSRFQCGDLLLVQCTEVSRFHVGGTVVTSLPSLRETHVTADQLCASSKEDLFRFF